MSLAIPLTISGKSILENERKAVVFLMQKPGIIILFANQYSQETQIQTQIDDEHQTIFDAYKNGDIEICPNDEKSSGQLALS